jgi:hypothetical protein
MTLSKDPLYLGLTVHPAGEYKPLNAGPSSGNAVIPRRSEPIDARQLGYPDPRATLDMHIARREGDPEDNYHRAAPEHPVKEKVAR